MKITETTPDRLVLTHDPTRAMYAVAAFVMFATLGLVLSLWGPLPLPAALIFLAAILGGSIELWRMGRVRVTFDRAQDRVTIALRRGKREERTELPLSALTGLRLRQRPRSKGGPQDLWQIELLRADHPPLPLRRGHSGKARIEPVFEALQRWLDRPTGST